MILLQKSGFDLAPRNDKTEKRNSLLNPFKYEGYSVITNPPYLMNNKTKDKNNIEVFSKYPGYIDLYQISMKTIIGAEEGIVIVPINFWTAERSGKIRNEFLSLYEVPEVKMFTYRVFSDTDYSVCAFYFRKSKTPIEEQNIIFRLIFESSEEKTTILLKRKNNFSINIDLENDESLELDRVAIGDTSGLTNIKLHLTDSAPNKYGIIAEIAPIYYCNKLKDRHFLTLKTNKKINEKEFVEKFNSELTALRDKYKSLFLGNYRNGNRKKFTIQDALRFSNHIITKYKLIIK